MSFVYALLTTALWVVLPGLVAAAASKQRPRAFTTAGITGVVFLLINWLVIFMGLPSVGFGMTVFWFSMWWMAIEALITAIIVGAASGKGDYEFHFEDVGWGSWTTAIVSVVLILIPMLGGVYGDGRAKTLAHEISVEMTKPGEYTTSDTNHLILLSADMAVFKAKNAMNQSVTLNIAGNKSNVNLSTIFELGTPVIQSKANHAYFEFALAPTGYRSLSATNDLIPGYMEVDAENPDATPTLVTKDATGHAISMAYYPGGYFSHNIDRLIWAKYPNRIVTDLTIEVDDQGKPWFTASLDKLTLNNQTTVPAQMLLIDPESGTITAKALNDVPDWIDRVYSAGTVEQMIDWWGEWNSAPWQMSETPVGRYKIPDNEDPTIVYAKGGHPEYQAIVTSYNSDTAASYLVMADARDNKAKAYVFPGLTLESTAVKTIEGSMKNIRKLHPAHMSLHKINGVLTWVSPLVSDSNQAFQGLALMNALDTTGSTVAINTTKDAALADYTLVAHNVGNSGKADEDANLKTVDAVVDRVSPPLAGGQSNNVTTAFEFTVVGDTHVYHVVADRKNPEASFIAKGAKVRLGYEDTGGILRAVMSYDDLGLALAA